MTQIMRFSALCVFLGLAVFGQAPTPQQLRQLPQIPANEINVIFYPVQPNPDVKILKYKLEMNQDNEQRVVHLSESLVSDKTAPAGMLYVSQDLWQRLQKVPGLEFATNTTRYAVVLRKGRAFDWETILPLVLESLKQMLAPNAELQALSPMAWPPQIPCIALPPNQRQPVQPKKADL